jgi:FKBP-type peptidyl-prolyl cis-trans isomerase
MTAVSHQISIILLHGVAFNLKAGSTKGYPNMMTRLRSLMLQAALLLWCCKTEAFQSSLFKEQIKTSPVASQLSTQLYAKVPSSEDLGSKGLTRASFLQTSLLGLVSATVAPTAVSAADDTTVPKPEGVSVYQLPSGVKYLELVPGTGRSPAYGQLCSVQYKAYVKLPASAKDPNPSPIQFDSDNGYLIKHGNGRIVPGFDEGLHSMKVGGRRRILVPNKLGYKFGLGPVPEMPWDRWRLNSMLDKMEGMKGGTIVFEVTLLSVMDDEADQGYYQDSALTEDEFETLKVNLRQKTADANTKVLEIK